MNLHDAIEQACSAVGIVPPRAHRLGKWSKTDTLSGKSGKGDGRVLVDEIRVTAWNWQTGEKSTVSMNGATPADKKKFAERRAKDDREQREKARRAADIANRLIAASRLAEHPYLSVKGFPREPAMVVEASTVASIGGDYLVAGKAAIVIPARIGSEIASAQLIWEDGTKKFLFGGHMGGAVHRIASGRDTWLCEGYATGLSIRAALKAMNRSATILVCFSASNILTVARKVEGRCFIAADNDKPRPQFDGLGTGEHYAQASGKPYAMPSAVEKDFNDVHMSEGIFAVQRAITKLIRENR